MAIGPGKYDDICTTARIQAGIGPNAAGSGVVLIVINGSKGSGFSVQADALTTLSLPHMLEHLAAQIRADTAEVK